MNYYHSFTEIADALIAELTPSGAFKEVEAAAVSDHKGLLGVLSNVKSAPRAFVCIGDGEFITHGLQRRLDVAVVIYSAYRAGEARKADSVWALVDAAVKPFLPVVVPGSAPVWPVIGGIEYQLQGWSPLATGGNAAFVVELSAVEDLKYTNLTT